jgi:hypothetical protein
MILRGFAHASERATSATTAAAVWHLWKGTGEEFSWPGFIIALVAIPVMRYLAHRKITIADA